eukprot:6480582-Amphidinium_carterae.1
MIMITLYVGRGSNFISNFTEGTTAPAVASTCSLSWMAVTASNSSSQRISSPSNLTVGPCLATYVITTVSSLRSLSSTSVHVPVGDAHPADNAQYYGELCQEVLLRHPQIGWPT